MIDNNEEICCNWCGDACGETICYSCQDTADDMGIDVNDF